MLRLFRDGSVPSIVWLYGSYSLCLHKGILDLLVRTDISTTMRLFAKRPKTHLFNVSLIRCPDCGRLLLFCQCRAGKDY